MQRKKNNFVPDYMNNGYVFRSEAMQDDCMNCMYFNPDSKFGYGLCSFKNRPCGYGMKCSHFEES